ncbi:hypothetical protein MBLNU459_g2911t1 [Dothideomycetes sp. NU459]
MAELAIGVVGLLVSLYSTCQDCFENVQVAQHCGEDYARLQCRLDLLNVKFTRWGAVMGLERINNTLTPARAAEILRAKTGEGQTVQQALEQIIKDFEQCQKKSAPYSKAARIYNPNTDLDPATQVIHRTLLGICHRRTKQASDKSKTSKISVNMRVRWAFYERKRFEKLILDLSDLVDALVELFPTTKEDQRRVGEEIQEIRTGFAALKIDAAKGQQALKELHDVAAETDRSFATALANVIGNAKTTYQVRDQLHAQNAFTLYGDQVTSETTAGKGKVGASAYDIAGGKHGGNAFTVYGTVYGSPRRQ